MRVVLDDEQHGVAVLDVVAVVLDVLLARDGQDDERVNRLAQGAAGWRGPQAIRTGIMQWQEERKRAALAVHARELDLAA